ncbi:PAS domain S-box protein [Phenylobacterium sp.]|uniref:hybrid sensor histidine kinase/response regulator n=1 Tax=Phenylobacterium sp. TaxID=1871053 RepID=UPI002F419CAF
MEHATPVVDVKSDERRYRLLVDAITDYAIYMLDVTGVVISWNPGAQRFKGYAADEIVGRHFSTFYTDEDRAAGLPELALRTAAEKGRFEREGWRVRKNGEQFWAHVIIDPIRAPSGKLVGFAKVTRDLTDRKEAEDALRRSEEQFKLLVQGVTDYAIYMLDREGRVTNWNPGAQRIKGYHPEEIVGQHFSRFYTQEDRDAGVPAHGLETALREGRWEQEGWRVRKGGERFWAHVVIDPIRDDGGSVVGFAKVTRDITERREAQQALEQAREALFQSQKLDAIGQLTGGVAHDFNNLLMAVLGSLELVRKRIPNDPRITPLVDNAIQGAQRGTTLTQRMLAFARKQELKLEAVDLTSLVQNMLNFLQRSIGPTIHIETCFAPGLPPVRTDPAQLETGLLNLVVNARDAMPNGGGISISARRETVGGGDGPLAPGEYIRLQVTDTGEGMDEATLARAAEPFFTTKGVGKGTGLGLSMVHGLTAQSGGRLTIHSRQGEGSSVELWLPVTAADAPGDPAAYEPVVDTAESRRLRILAVDDDSLVLRNTAALLEDLGHHVIEAASGQEALAALAHHPHLDLMITDQAMPQMTGLELREAVLADRPQLPVLIATGYAETPAGVDLRASRISKPFTQDALAAAIRDLVPAKAER